MSKIDTSRISSIFRTLSPTHAQKRNDRSDSASTKDVNERKDAEVLRAKLIDRVRALDKTSDDFVAHAKEATIREILVWEFGDEILNHPSFKQIASSITLLMSEDSTLNASFDELITDIALKGNAKK